MCYVKTCSLCIGTMVFVGIHTLHHDSLVWDDPEVITISSVDRVLFHVLRSLIQ